MYRCYCKYIINQFHCAFNCKKRRVYNNETAEISLFVFLTYSISQLQQMPPWPELSCHLHHWLWISVSLTLLFIFRNGCSQSTSNSLKKEPGPQCRVKPVILAVKLSTSRDTIGEKYSPRWWLLHFLSSSHFCQLASKSSLIFRP